MTTYLAMLRGINVGGHATVSMADLRATFVDMGYGDARTYIQSGNVLFGASGPAAALQSALEKALEGRFGLDIKVVLRTRAQLLGVIKANPLATGGRDPAKLHVTFLASTPASTRLSKLNGEGWLPDELDVAAREVYLYCPEGYGRTKLNTAFFERTLGVPATTRTWKTVTTLARLEV